MLSFNKTRNSQKYLRTKKKFKENFFKINYRLITVRLQLHLGMLLSFFNSPLELGFKLEKNSMWLKFGTAEK